MAMSVHEPFALRGVVQLICEDGVVGLGESYGDLAFPDQVRKTCSTSPPCAAPWRG
jgi:glucarate dehydratase